MKVQITREKVRGLDALTEAVVSAENTASELLRTAQDRSNHLTEDVEREGKMQKISRKTLWDEVFYLGGACQAAGVLKKYHPEVFEAYGAMEKAADDLKKFCTLELDIDFTKMRIRDYLSLTEGMFNMMIDERFPQTDGSVRSPIQP